MPDTLTDESRSALETLASAAPPPADAADIPTTAEIVAAMRAMVLALSPLQGEPLPMHGVTDLQIDGPAGALTLRLYRPAPGRLPVILYLHGGGFIAGSVQAYDTALRVLAHRTGWAVAAVDYRLAPEHPYPAAPEDCFAAFRHVTGHAADHDLDGARVVIAGDSAGGLLSVVVALMARDRGGPAPAGLLCLYPNADMREDRDYPSLRLHDGKAISVAAVTRLFRLYIPDAANRLQPYASPVLASLSGLPRALFITSGCDPLRDEGEALANRMRDAGSDATVVRLQGALHGVLSIVTAVPAAAAQMFAAMTGFLRGIQASDPVPPDRAASEVEAAILSSRDH